MADIPIDALEIRITSNADEVARRFADLKNRLDSLRTRNNGVQLQVTGATPAMTQRIYNFAAAIDNLAQTGSSAAFATALTNLERLSALRLNLRTDRVQQLAQSISQIMGGTAGQTNQPQDLLPDVTAPENGDAIEETGERARTAGERLRDFTARLREAHAGSSRLVGGLTNLLRSFGRIAMYRALRAALKMITQAFKEGINEVYLYSKTIDGTFKQSMDTLATSAEYFKASLGAMIAPLINMVAPFIDQFVDKLVEGMNALNEVFARLNGQTTFTRAIKTQKEYTDAALKSADANNKLKQSFLGIDEINTLKDSSSSGSTSTVGYEFEEVPVDIMKTDELIGKLKDVLDVVGLIAAGIALWDVTKFLNGLGTVGTKMSGILTIAVGEVFVAKGTYDMGLNGVDLGNVVETVLGGAAAAIGGYIVAGPTGALLTIPLTLLVGTLAYQAGQVQKILNEDEMYQEILRIKSESEEHLRTALTFDANVELHYQDAMTDLNTINGKFDLLKEKVNEAFDLSGKEGNLTSDEMAKIQLLADELNGYGIEIDIDADGRIKNTKEDILKMVDGIKEFYLISSLNGAYQQAIADNIEAQYLLEQQTGNTAQAENIAKEAYLEFLEKLKTGAGSQGGMAVARQALSDFNDVTDISAGLLDTYTSKLNGANAETKAAAQKAKDAYDAYNNEKQALDVLTEDVDKTTERMGFFENALVEAKAKMNNLEGKTNETSNAIDNLNGKTVSPNVDASALDDLHNKIKNLKKELDESGTEITLVGSSAATKKLGGGALAYAYANGGYPDTGSLFVAGEAGPELVGTIGGRTAVANTDSIANGLASANDGVIVVLNAILNAVNSKSLNVNIDSRKISSAQAATNRMYGVAQNV